MSGLFQFIFAFIHRALGKGIAQCRRNRSGQCTLELFRTTAFNSMAATHSIENGYFHSISTDFNKPQNLVRDQGVGGSNPLSTEGSSISGFSPSLECKTIYKNIHNRKR